MCSSVYRITEHSRACFLFLTSFHFINARHSLEMSTCNMHNCCQGSHTMWVFGVVVQQQSIHSESHSERIMVTFSALCFVPLNSILGFSALFFTACTQRCAAGMLSKKTQQTPHLIIQSFFMKGQWKLIGEQRVLD